MPGEVRIRGLAELQRDLKRISKDLGKELKDELRVVAEPVRMGAERLAVQNISHIGSAWSGMRIGMTARTVYVAPKRRRRGGSPRPNLGGLLMDRAMQPALDENEDKIVARVEFMLDRLGDTHGF